MKLQKTNFNALSKIKHCTSLNLIDAGYIFIFDQISNLLQQVISEYISKEKIANVQ